MRDIGNRGMLLLICSDGVCFKVEQAFYFKVEQVFVQLYCSVGQRCKAHICWRNAGLFSPAQSDVNACNNDMYHLCLCMLLFKMFHKDYSALTPH